MGLEEWWIWKVTVMPKDKIYIVMELKKGNLKKLLRT